MRPNIDNSRGGFRYSYTANDWYMNPIQNTFAAGFAKDDRYGGTKFTGKITSIKTPSEKVLLVCTDELTLIDGIFKAAPASWAASKCNLVSSRHEKKVVSGANNINPAAINQNARGNVGFTDGHAEFFSRKDALRARYSGRPDADPAGF
jgi:prepilin-type processing-associated H-X9-DG protein